MRLYLSVAFVLLLLTGASAQFEKNYTPVVSRGTLPKDFVTLSAKKFEAEKSKLSKSEKRSTRKSKETFLLQSNFGIDEILLSGRVLFNDPLAEYVNKVADKALASEPALRSELRFYVLKSPSVNAFATNQGIVFVNMGLLAQLENEAQLAFVLCHEAVHYKEKHAIEKYLETDKIVKGKGVYKQMNLDEKLISKCSFSKEQEKESDEKGLQIFLKSDYSTANLMGVYDVLKYAYLPFDDVVFEKEFLENTTLKIPGAYNLTETKEITTANIDDEDERSTHPNLKSRRQGTQEMITGVSNAGKADYQVGEANFKQVREIARFELSRLYTLAQRYEEGIYNSYMLLKKYPDNLFLKKNVANCLAGLAQYSTAGEFSDVHKATHSVEGKSQAVNFLMSKLDSVRGDLTVVTVAYIAKLRKQYPADKEIKELLISQLSTLVKRNNLGTSDFSRYPATDSAIVDSLRTVEREKEKADTLNQVKQEKAEKSKYDKLRELENTSPKAPGIVTGGRFIKYAFVEYMEEPWFKDAFEVANKDRNKNEDKMIVIDDDEAYRRRYYDKKTFALGINKVVIVDPYFARINATKKREYKYLQSEAGQVDFAGRLKSNGDAAKLGVEVLNTKNLQADECDKVNEVAIMEEYITNRLALEKTVNLPYAERERVEEIAKKYDTDHFMWTGTISLTDNTAFKKLMVLSCVFPVSLPFTLGPLVNRGQYTLYFALMYNVKTDEVEYATFREINNRTNGYILDSHIYDVFNQIKSTKTAKKK